MWDVRDLTADDWTVLQGVRLAALRDSPAAFASTYEHEMGLDEERWRARAAGAVWLVAFDGNRPVGIVAAIQEPDAPATERHIVSMWVAPEHRRKKIASRLVAALLERLAADGAHTVWLWVMNGNDTARSVYERLGFVRTGERQPLPGDPTRIEQRMIRRLP